MLKAKVLKITATIAGCACIMLVLAAPLPGEVGGCEPDSGVAVDPVKYCMDKCAVKAQKEVTECDIFSGAYTEQQVYDMCYIAWRCDNPSWCDPRCNEADPLLCPEESYWQPFVSTTEAEACLEAQRLQTCDIWGTITPPECSDTVLCDPK
jgi:hypothetical protein